MSQKQPSTCDNLLQWGAFFLIGYLIFKFFETKSNESNSTNDAKDTLTAGLANLRQRFAPDSPQYSTKTQISVDGNEGKITKSKRSVVPLPKGKKYGLVGSRKVVSKEMSEFEKRADALLPKEDQNLTESEKKWISKAHLPSLSQIKDAQYIRQDSYFHQIPIKNRREGSTVVRAPLSKPTPPNLLFDQPIVD
jgi:hypothetical protein